MARRLERLQADGTKLDRRTVSKRLEGIFGTGPRAEMNRCLCAVAQLQVSRDEVGVEVRQDDVVNF